MILSYSKPLEQAKRHLKNSKNLLDFTLKIIGDNKIIAKSLIELQKSTSFIIDTILITYLKKIPIDKEKKATLFFQTIAKKKLTNNEIKELRKILETAKKHKESHLEFTRKEKLVIFHDKKYIILTEKSLKNSINLVEAIIFKLDQKRKI